MHRYAYIRKPFNGNGWVSAPENWTLTDTEILKAAARVHPHSYLGARFGKSTRFAVLDIDAQSKYHNKRELRRLIDAIVDAGLMPPAIYRSSNSGGWHLYLFFDEPISSVQLRRELFKLLSFYDFEIGKGQLEIFPNTNGDSLGLGCRLPLQNGFAWINSNTLELDEERDVFSPVEAVSKFLHDAQDANSYQDFCDFKRYVQKLAERKDAVVAKTQNAPANNVVPIRRPRQSDDLGEHRTFVKAVFHRLPPGILVDNWYKGRLYHLHGLTGPSQRAEAIECVGHYLFYGDPSRDLSALGYGYEQEREWAITEFLKARHNGQSHEINRGLADAYGQVERAANWRPSHKQSIEPEKFTPAVPIVWIRANAKRQADARLRIAKALEGLKAFGRYFATDDLRKAAKCSKETLFKHKDIWEKDYEDLASGLFAISTGEYNCVEGTVSSPLSFDPALPSERLVSPQNQPLAGSSLDAAEKDSLDSVRSVTETDPSELSIAQLKALLTVLAAYLSVAPNYECQQFVQERIGLVRNQLAVASETSLFVVRPP